MIALVGGASLGGGDDGGGSGSGSSSTATLTIPTTAKVGVLLDSVVGGVSFETSISLRAYRLQQWALQDIPSVFVLGMSSKVMKSTIN